MSHLTLEDRITIYTSLQNNMSVTEISKLLNKHVSTISREIKNHLIVKSRKEFRFNRRMNDCVHRYTCTKHHVCNACIEPNLKCKFCGLCFASCEDYEKEVCPTLKRAPHVCNGCRRKNTCTLEQKYYHPNEAQKEYKDNLVSFRSGFNFTEEELVKINNELAPLITEQKQSVYHACLIKADILPCDIKTIYNLIDANMLPDIKNIDLPRKCRLKPRKAGKRAHKIDKQCRINRTYVDYKNYMRANPDLSVIEMDTVEGTKGGKCIITLLFTSCNLQLFYLVDDHTSQKVIDTIDKLYEHILGKEVFESLFQVILTDNGTEFSNPSRIENSILNEPRCKVFYCDPAASYQKGTCENNHEMLRRFIPKGHTFDNLTQHDLDIISSHINSYKRKKLNNYSPIDLFSFLYGEHILEKLNLLPISPEKICLSLDVLNK